MDARRFDALSRALSEAGTRRGLLGLLATLPVLGGLLTLLDLDETAAGGRRRRRKKRHKHGRPRPHGKRKCQKKCKPQSLAKTCSGKCGPVRNNCKKTVDCGTCVCGDVCADGCQFSTVQSAIDTLPADSTIRICAGTYGAITISKDLTLIGMGDGDDATSNTILDAAQLSRVVLVDHFVTATLQGLRITGGVSPDSGGGVYNQGTLTMSGCTVTGNAAPEPGTGGGGIANNPSGNLTMTDCTISHNSASTGGGGINHLNGQLSLTNCTLHHNSTPNNIGGAIKCNNGGSSELFGCTIGPNNEAPDGSGICLLNASTMTLNNTSVSGNTAASRGGGIRNSSGTVELENGSTVSGNSAPTDPNCSGTISGTGCA